MRKFGMLLLAGFATLLPFAVEAQQRVDGYNRRDGTYVQPYTRSTPNNSYNDNYSVRGNQNPYTGAYGTQSPTYNDRTPSSNRQNYGTPMYDTNDSRRSRY